MLTTAGAIAALAMTGSLWLTHGWASTLGFTLVGFALSPIVPLGMSLAGRHAPPSTQGRAIGLTNTLGYSAFLTGPTAAGAIADHSTLTTGLTLAATTMLAISLVSLTLPAHPRSR